MASCNPTATNKDESCDVSSTTPTPPAVVISVTPVIPQIDQPAYRKKAYNRGRWIKDEDDKLKVLVQKYGENNWLLVASQFPDRSDFQCQQRWAKVVNPQLIKGPWTVEVSSIMSNLSKL